MTGKRCLPRHSQVPLNVSAVASPAAGSGRRPLAPWPRSCRRPLPSRRRRHAPAPRDSPGRGSDAGTARPGPAGAAGCAGSPASYSASPTYSFAPVPCATPAHQAAWRSRLRRSRHSSRSAVCTTGSSDSRRRTRVPPWRRPSTWRCGCPASTTPSMNGRRPPAVRRGVASLGPGQLPGAGPRLAPEVGSAGTGITQQQVHASAGPAEPDRGLTDRGHLSDRPATASHRTGRRFPPEPEGIPGLRRRL